ncbi:MAG: hypothetical protein KJ718_06565 [Nanoarchaeota archaeon]|nr:hypothetical protein [Nanoarchaeota archaeon]
MELDRKLVDVARLNSEGVGRNSIADQLGLERIVVANYLDIFSDIFENGDLSGEGHRESLERTGLSSQSFDDVARFYGVGFRRRKRESGS